MTAEPTEICSRCHQKLSSAKPGLTFSQLNERGVVAASYCIDCLRDLGVDASTICPLTTESSKNDEEDF